MTVTAQNEKTVPNNIHTALGLKALDQLNYTQSQISHILELDCFRKGFLLDFQDLFRESGTDCRLSGMFCGLPAGADGGPGSPSDRTPGS